jgi:hypothetical protein
MAKRRLNPADMDPNLLGRAMGITDEDRSEGFHPAQEPLKEESRKKASRSTNEYSEDERLTSVMPVGEAQGQSASRIRNTVDKFKNARTTGEKNIHRKAAWDLVEGITRDSGSEDSGRRTRATFVHGQELPCANESCHNTVPYEAPAVEKEAEKRGGPRASDVTCAEGKCNIPGSEAPTRSRE